MVCFFRSLLSCLYTGSIAHAHRCVRGRQRRPAGASCGGGGKCSLGIWFEPSRRARREGRALARSLVCWARQGGGPQKRGPFTRSPGGCCAAQLVSSHARHAQERSRRQLNGSRAHARTAQDHLQVSRWLFSSQFQDSISSLVACRFNWRKLLL